jgi:tight adherence protein B
VTNTIRERERLRREVLVMTSRQRLTAYLMAAMPVLVGFAYVSLNPEAGRMLYEETAGQIALGIGVFFEIVGFLIIRRLSAIEV